MDILLDYVYELNWLTVIVAACVGMLIGAAWYSDSLFGKPWLKATKLSKKDTEKPAVSVGLAIALFTLLLTAAAMGVLIAVLQLTSAQDGVLFGVLVATGFLVTNNGMHKLFEQRPFTLFAITAVGDILTLSAMGAILAVWQ